MKFVFERCGSISLAEAVTGRGGARFVSEISPFHFHICEFMCAERSSGSLAHPPPPHSSSPRHTHPTPPDGDVDWQRAPRHRRFIRERCSGQSTRRERPHARFHIACVDRPASARHDVPLLGETRSADQPSFVFVPSVTRVYFADHFQGDRLAFLSHKRQV